MSEIENEAFLGIGKNDSFYWEMLVLSCSGSFLEFGDVVRLGEGHGSGTVAAASSGQARSGGTALVFRSLFLSSLTPGSH